MFQRLQRAFLGAMMLCLLAVVAPAFAQAQSWLPNFDSQTHVYVDPALKNNPNYPVDFSSMDGELRRLSSPHNLQVYVVATERSFDPSRVIAREVADDLQQRWVGHSGFPKDDFLLIVWVRQASDPNKGSVAAYAGNRLQTFGFTSTRMSDKINGPVTPALKQFMPRDPQSALLQIVRNVNNGVDQAVAAQKQAEQDRIAAAERAQREQIEAAKRAEQDRIDAANEAIAASERAKTIQMYAVIGIPSALLIGLLIFLTLRFNRAKARAREVIEAQRTQLQNAGHWYDQLEESYMGFLKRQADWQKRFDPKGRTAKQFGEAVGAYANLTTRKLAAADMFDRAEKSFNSAHWPMSGGFDKAIAILTSEEVTVSDKNLSIEDAELFKGLVVEKKYAPAELLADMEDLFKKTNTALAEIKRAFEGAFKNRAEIADLLNQVEALKAKLIESKLNFEPYQGRYDQIGKERDEFLAIIDKDPLTAFGGTQKVEEDAMHLKADIEHALALSASMADAVKQLDAAKARVVQVRSQECKFAYPEAGMAPAAANFTLKEPGSNPDDSISEAASHLAEANKALLAGDLAKAESEKALSCQDSAAAVKLVDAVLAAKAFVEKQVMQVRQNLGRLQAELPDASKNVDALKADFLAKNFAGEPEKLASAQRVNQATEAELSKVRNAYLEQSFIGSRRLLENVGSEVQGSREKLVEVATRLKQLRDLRTHAKAAVAQAEQTSGALASKLEGNAFTTSKSTDDAFARMAPVLRDQKADVARDVTDWPAAADAADKLLADMKNVDSSIDNEKKAYELAGSRIEAVRQAINSAAAVVGGADTRRPAQQKLAEARQVLAGLESAYKVAKSDWAALARNAESQKNVAVAAEELAEADHRLANQARSAISEAEGRIRSLAIRSFTQTVSWGGYSQVISLGTVLDLSEANRLVGEASAYLRNWDFENAISTAQRADAAADRAEAWANAQLLAMAQELQARWMEEQRRRDEEERRRREEEQRRRDEEQRRRDEEDRRRREEEDRRRDEQNRRSGGDNTGGNTSGGDNYGNNSSPPTGSGGDNY